VDAWGRKQKKKKQNELLDAVSDGIAQTSHLAVHPPKLSYHVGSRIYSTVPSFIIIGLRVWAAGGGVEVCVLYVALCPC